MESNNTILNNENFLNTFQHFPNNMALELNSISLSNTHTNNTDFNLINNNNYSSSNNLGTDREKYLNSKINTIQPNEQMINLSMAISQNLNISSDNNKNKEDEEEEEECEEENEENEDNINATEGNNHNENNSLPEFTYGNILQNINENENVTLLNTFSYRNNNNFNTFSNFHLSNNNLNQQQENISNNNIVSYSIINKSEENTKHMQAQINKN